MTALPAQKFHLKDRGILKDGCAADVVIFDDKEVQDRSSFERPHQYSTGCIYVLVNGQLVMDSGRYTGVKSGNTLPAAGYKMNE